MKDVLKKSTSAFDNDRTRFIMAVMVSNIFSIRSYSSFIVRLAARHLHKRGIIHRDIRYPDRCSPSTTTAAALLSLPPFVRNISYPRRLHALANAHSAP